MKKKILAFCIVFLLIHDIRSQHSSRTAKIEKSFAAGLNVSNYVFENSSYTYGYLTDADKPKSTTFNLGFYVKLYNPQLSNRFSLSSGLIYFSINQSYKFIDQLSIYTRYIYDVTLKNSYLKIPLLINYDFMNSSVRPYILAGTHTNLVLAKNNHLTTTRIDPTNTSVTNQFPHGFSDHATKDLETLGLSLGVGIRYLGRKKPGYNLEVKYESIQSLSNISGAKAKSLFLTFGIIF